MSDQGAPSQRTLWSWLEKDFETPIPQQRNNKQKITNENARTKTTKRKSRNDHRKAKKNEKETPTFHILQKDLL